MKRRLEEVHPRRGCRRAGGSSSAGLERAQACLAMGKMGLWTSVEASSRVDWRMIKGMAWIFFWEEGLAMGGAFGVLRGKRSRRGWGEEGRGPGVQREEVGLVVRTGDGGGGLR